MKDSYSTLYYEIYALMSIELAFPEYSRNMLKGECPDWHSIIDNIGLEISRAENNHIGYCTKFSNTYLGKNRKEIPSQKISEFKGNLFFDDNDKLFAISDSKGLVDGCRHIHFAISSVENKLKRLNSCSFCRFNENDLYLFLTNSIHGNDLSIFLEKYHCIEREFQYRFSRIFLFDNNSLYSIIIKDYFIKQYCFSGEALMMLKFKAKHLCGNWSVGKPFYSQYRHLLL